MSTEKPKSEVSPNPESTLNWQFGLQWLITNTVCLLLIAVGLLLWIENNGSLPAGVPLVISVGVAALLVALTQWYVLGQSIQLPLWWLVATFLGYWLNIKLFLAPVVPPVVLSRIIRFLWPGLDEGDIWSQGVAALLIMLVYTLLEYLSAFLLVGILQWLGLRRRVRLAGQWIVYHTVSLSAAFLVSGGWHLGLFGVSAEEPSMERVLLRVGVFAAVYSALSGTAITLHFRPLRIIQSSQVSRLVQLRHRTNTYVGSTAALVLVCGLLLTRGIRNNAPIPPPDDTIAGETSFVMKQRMEELTVAAFSPDGSLIATGNTEGDVGLWDVTAQQQIRTFKAHDNKIDIVAFSPDGRLVFSAGRDNQAHIWDLVTGELLHTLELSSNLFTAVGFTSDSSMALIGANDHFARIWNLDTGEVLKFETSHLGSVRSIALSPDDSLVYSGGDIGFLWELDTQEILYRRDSEQVPREVAEFSPDGKSILTLTSPRIACLWDVATGETIHELRGGRYGFSMASFSPDGSQVLVAARAAGIWDMNTGWSTLYLEGHRDQITALAYSPDGKLVLTGSYDNTARLWELETGETLHIFAGQADDGRYKVIVAFSPDGRLALTASLDGTVRVLDMTSSDILP